VFTLTFARERQVFAQKIARWRALMGCPGIYRFSRIVPQIMSLLALTVCVIGWSGVVRDPLGDEGALAHVYQLSMVAQIPFVIFFLIVTLRERIWKNAPVAALQIALWISAVLAVRLFHL
jgi:hypothetical protein